MAFEGDEELAELIKRKAASIIEEAGRCCSSEFEGGVVEIGYPEELRDVVEGCKVAFVFFYTPTCPYCRIVAPLFEEAAAYYSGRAAFAKLNLARMPFVADALGILGTPTIIVFINGREAGRLVGLVDGERLEVAVESALRAAGCPASMDGMSAS